MNHIYVRPLRLFDETDKAAFVAAVEGKNLQFPANLFTLPSTQIMVAERRESHGIEVVMYQPFYHSLVLGSIVPLGTHCEVASALHQMTAAAYTKANAEGYADVVMYSNTPETKAFAQRHGYEPMHDGFRLDVR